MHPAIVLITTSYPIKGDGSEAAGSFVVDLAMELAAYAPVRVVAPGSEFGVEVVSECLSIYRYPAPAKALSTLRPWKINDILQIGRVLRSGRLATETAIDAGPTKHVLSLWALPSGMWARIACRNRGLPYSVWTLGSDIWTLGRIPLLRTYLARVLRDSSLCYSDGLKLAAQTQAISKKKVIFLPSARNIDAQGILPPRSQHPYRLLFLGRWHKNKGVDLLLGALELLDESAWARISMVHIAGGGPLAKLVHARVKLLKSAGRQIVLDGFLDKTQAVMAIAESDVVMIPSRIESIPVIFSDAIKLGRPVLVSPVGDLPSLISKFSCGVVSRDVSAQGLAEAIASILAMPLNSFRHGLDVAGEQFLVEHVAARLAEDLT